MKPSQKELFRWADRLLVYRHSESSVRGLLPRTEEQNDRYTNTDNDARGEWASDNYVSNKSKEERPALWYAIKHPRTGEDVWPDEHTVWRYSFEKHLQIEPEGRLYWGPYQSDRKPRLKRYLKKVQQGIVPPTWWKFENCGHNDEAQKETAALVGQKVFSTPKPIRLISRMVTIGVGKDDIVMDFFAGSSSTGHAVMAKNVADGGKRRTEADILYELLLKLGLDLCVSIEKRSIVGKEIHAIGGGALLACLAKKITRDDVESLAQGIVEWHKLLAPAGDTTCVFRDSAFVDDVAKTNLAAILNQHGLKKVRSL